MMTSPLLQATFRSIEYCDTDGGSRADKDFAYISNVNCDEGWYWPGAVAATSPVMPYSMMYIRPHPSTFSEPVATIPNWSRVWHRVTDNIEHTGREFSMWKPTPPDGYVTLGDMFVPGTTLNVSVLPVAVSMDCVKKVPFGGRIWDDSGSGADEDGSIFAINDGTGPWFRFLCFSGYGEQSGETWALDMSKVEVV